MAKDIYVQIRRGDHIPVRGMASASAEYARIEDEQEGKFERILLTINVPEEAYWIGCTMPPKEALMLTSSLVMAVHSGMYKMDTEDKQSWAEIASYLSMVEGLVHHAKDKLKQCAPWINWTESEEQHEQDSDPADRAQAGP